MLKLLKKLHNPFFLVGQGFLVGAAVFLATHDRPIDSEAAGPVAEASFFERMTAKL